jgi:hypothetical protein
MARILNSIIGVHALRQTSNSNAKVVVSTSLIFTQVSANFIPVLAWFSIHPGIIYAQNAKVFYKENLPFLTHWNKANKKTPKMSLTSFIKFLHCLIGGAIIN